MLDNGSARCLSSDELDTTIIIYVQSATQTVANPLGEYTVVVCLDSYV